VTTDFELCSEDADSCRFNATVAGGTCNDACSSGGGTCIDAEANDPAGCANVNADVVDCTTTFMDGVCECTRPPGA
jgi:hypothetical protein